MRPTKRHINRKFLLFPFAILAIVLIACGSLPEDTATALVRIQPQGDVIRDSMPDNSSSASESSEMDIAPNVSPTPLPAPQLDVIVPPCIRMPGSPVDPCQRRDSWPHFDPNVSFSMEFPEIFLTLRDTILLREWPDDVPHFIVRATVIPDSIRCGNSDFRLFLDSSYDTTFPETPSIGQPYCFIDLVVNEYLVGRGPNRLTVNTGVRADFITRGEPDCDVACLTNGAERVRATAIEGVEWVFSLGGPSDLGVLAWEIVYRWDVQKQDDGEVVVVDYWKHDMLLHSSPENYETNLSRL